MTGITSSPARPSDCRIPHGDGRSVAIYNTDCVAGMNRILEPGTVDVVVTSPPYNLGTVYSGYDDTIGRDEYVRWMGEWGGAIAEILSDRGSVFLNIGGKPSDPWGPFEVLSELRDCFVLQNVIHWIKSVAIQKEDVGRYAGIESNVSVGHFKPINSPRYVNDCHEYIFHLTKKGDVELDRLAIGVEYQDKSNVSRWSSAKDDRRCRGNTWFVPYKTIRSREKQRPHPASFPRQDSYNVHRAPRTRAHPPRPRSVFSESATPPSPVSSSASTVSPSTPLPNTASSRLPPCAKRSTVPDQRRSRVPLRNAALSIGETKCRQTQRSSVVRLRLDPAPTFLFDRGVPLLFSETEVGGGAIHPIVYPAPLLPVCPNLLELLQLRQRQNRPERRLVLFAHPPHILATHVILRLLQLLKCGPLLPQQLVPPSLLLFR